LIGLVSLHIIIPEQNDLTITPGQRISPTKLITTDLSVTNRTNAQHVKGSSKHHGSPTLNDSPQSSQSSHSATYPPLRQLHKCKRKRQCQRPHPRNTQPCSCRRSSSRPHYTRIISGCCGRCMGYRWRRGK